MPVSTGITCLNYCGTIRSLQRAHPIPHKIKCRQALMNQIGPNQLCYLFKPKTVEHGAVRFLYDVQIQDFAGSITPIRTPLASSYSKVQVESSRKR